ncbi:DUF5302 domain-containing protein [Streptomyces sp. NPDC088387]|uniref:DUF5302 domain-containing protein n=1 Tax=Streptomyces sp. NPDC088387 TaxID=3365859 RepID=UPI003810B2EF
MTETPAPKDEKAAEATDAPEVAETAETNDDTEAKRKFQEALQRKASASKSREAHQGGRGKIGGFNGPRGQQRTFRRKSG